MAIVNRESDGNEAVDGDAQRREDDRVPKVIRRLTDVLAWSTGRDLPLPESEQRMFLTIFVIVYCPCFGGFDL
jgi:hypothetical protein